MELTLRALEGLPEVVEGQDLSEIVLQSAQENQWIWEDGDAVVLAQKIVSKAEGRFVNLGEVKPGARALQYAKYIDKDARLIELILRESKKVLRTRDGLMIVEHRLGFVCANAGIDHSNISVKGSLGADWVLLLPENPDQSARLICEAVQKNSGKKIGVLIIDSHGRAWRKGVVGVSIGLCGIPGVVDRRGQKDRNDFVLRVTEIGAADELAAAASLIMGQGAEGRPIVIARGFPYNLRESSIEEIIRHESEDLFR